MKRYLAALLVIGLMMMGLNAVAQQPRTDREALEAIAQILVEQGIVLPTTTSTTVAPTTTTTAAPTTTVAPTTTTTAAPTTTTTAVPTTTTTVPDSGETLPYGPFTKANAYRFEVDELPSGEPDWWSAEYHFDLPYADGYGWGAGNRVAYRCMHGPLIRGGTKINTGNNDQQDLIGGTIVGRFAVVRTLLEQTSSEGDAYIRINDTYMADNARSFDGTYYGNYGDGAGDQVEPISVCDQILTHEYADYFGPDQRPVIVFKDDVDPNPNVIDMDTIERRDYRNTNAGAGVRFVLLDGDGSDGVVAVGAVGPDNKIAVVVYYYGLNGGTVSAFLP